MTLEDKLPAFGTPEWQAHEEKYSRKTLVQDLTMGGIILGGGLLGQGLALYEGFHNKTQGRTPETLFFFAVLITALGGCYISKAYEWQSKRSQLTSKFIQQK